jgi:hypothetical protein
MATGYRKWYVTCKITYEDPSDPSFREDRPKLQHIFISCAAATRLYLITIGELGSDGQMERDNYRYALDGIEYATFPLICGPIFTHDKASDRLIGPNHLWILSEERASRGLHDPERVSTGSHEEIRDCALRYMGSYRDFIKP